MIIPRCDINQYQKNNKLNNTNFGSRSSIIRETDDICRRVIKEFPVASHTKMLGYKTIKSTQENNNYLNFVRDVICKYREYYDKTPNVKKKLLKEISGMKKMNVGNCAELSDATYVALKLNGVKDVKLLHLYAYSPKAQSMRVLDHCIVGINFKLPKGYKYNTCSPGELFVNPECRIYPQKESIIVDSWAGFVDYGQNAANKFKSNRALIECNNSGIRKNKETLLYDDEELCYVPLQDWYNLKKTDLEYYEKMYPDLMLPKNKSVQKNSKNRIWNLISSIFGNKNNSDITRKKRFSFQEISTDLKDEIRVKHSLKAAPTEEEMNARHQAYINSVNEKYGLKPL